MSCSHIFCTSPVSYYCYEHKLPICMNCKHDHHYICKIKCIHSKESLKFQLHKLYELLENLESHSRYLVMSDSVFEGQQMISHFKVELIEIKARMAESIKKEEFLSFEKYEKALIGLRVRIDNDKNIKTLSVQCYQQVIFKKLKVYEAKDLLSEDQNLSKDIKFQYLKSIEDPKQEEGKTCSQDQENIYQLENLRAKYLKEQNKLCGNRVLELDLSRSQDVDFMKECINKNIKLPKIQAFGFADINQESEIFRQYVEECFLDNVFIELHVQVDDFTHFSDYSSSFKKLLHCSPKILSLTRFIVSHKDLKAIKDTDPKNKRVFCMTDCLIISNDGKKLSMVKGETKKEYNIRGILYTPEELYKISRIISPE
ncbi:unnamed protein product [Moneuplotes crassus]|uniref:Uncharacterized protein n=1 Tax=Euplotes crassus TaxID=5936 RepID=A0AAD2CXG3_EUPCR|nr:unnamed protein product [Moneuplotes crassus]